MQLDHLILHVTKHETSVQFYKDVLGLTHDGFTEPFQVMRLNQSTTIDLMESPPKEPAHLAFSVDRTTFGEVLRRLRERGIEVGSGPFTRDGRIGANGFGASGPADAFYFSDPDGHNLELRCNDISR